MMFLRCTLIALCTAALATLALAAEVQFDDKGLSSIKVDGVERLSNGVPTVFQTRGPATAPVVNRLVDSKFNPADKTLTQNYTLLQLTTRYQIMPQGVKLQLSVKNTSPEPIHAVSINLASFHGLGENQRPGRPAWGVADLPMTFASGSNGALLLSMQAGDKPMQIDFAEQKNARNKIDLVNARLMAGGDRIIVDNVTMQRVIAPGASDQFDVELRVGGAGATVETLAKDVIDAYRAARPAVINWPDRRPILRLFFGGGLPKEQAIENLKNPDAVKPPAVDEKFRERFLARMKGTVAAGKATNAQGVILWDLEGETFPHATTYIGDPRLIRLLNPQMDLVVDEGVKILQDGGLNVGITLRPSRVIYNTKSQTASHSYTDAKDPYLELEGKIEYARKRWNLRMFYIDTNFFWRPYGPEKKWASGQITPDVWQRLAKKYPDTLFIPEFGNVADYQSVAAYGEADMGDYGINPLIRAVWPDAFRVLVIEDADAYDNFDRFVSAVQQGHVLMTYGYGPDVHNVVAMRRIYQQAAWLKDPAPAGNGETKSRFQAALALGANPTPAGNGKLLAMAMDDKEDWLVRHAALQSLAKSPQSDAKQIPALLDLLTSRQGGLYAAASKVLVRYGDAAVDPILLRVEKLAESPTADTWQIESLGEPLAAVEAKSAVARLRTAFDKIPESKRRATIQRAFLTVMARLKSPDLEDLFTAHLNSPLREPAAVGLTLLGTESSTGKVKAALEEARKVKDAAAVEQLTRASRAK